MKVIAIRQICGEYGSMRPGQEFNVSTDLANKLLKAKMVREPDAFTYEVKAIQPQAATVQPEHTEPKISNKRK